MRIAPSCLTLLLVVACSGEVVTPDPVGPDDFVGRWRYAGREPCLHPEFVVGRTSEGFHGTLVLDPCNAQREYPLVVNAAFPDIALVSPSRFAEPLLFAGRFASAPTGYDRDRLVGEGDALERID